MWVEWTCWLAAVMSVWTCCWYCNSLAPRWFGRRRFLPMRGYPEFGYWMCKSDWVPHGLNGECLHTSRLGEYDALQMTGQGYKELIDNCTKTWQGCNSPQRWKSTMRREPAGHPNKGTQAAAQIKKECWVETALELRDWQICKQHTVPQPPTTYWPF